MALYTRLVSWLKRKFCFRSSIVSPLPRRENRDVEAASHNVACGSKGIWSHDAEQNSILPVPTISEQCNDLESVDRVKTSCTEILDDRLNVNKNKSVGNVEAHLKIMYTFCTSAYQGTQEKVNGPKKGLYILKMIVFWLTVILSLFQSFCDAKYALLWFLFGGGVRRFVRVVFSVTGIATSLFVAQTFFWKRNLLRGMISIMKSFELRWETGKSYCTLPMTVTMITTLIAFMRSFLLLEIRDTTMKNIILYSSYLMSEDLFLWSSDNLNITSQHLDIKYGSNVNIGTILLALAKIARDFVYGLQAGMLGDLFLTIVVTFHCYMKTLNALLRKTTENTPTEKLESGQNILGENEHAWGMYRELKSVFNAVNNVFGPLLILFHITNLLRYAVFMERCVYLADTAAIVYIQLLYDIVKSEIIYILAARIANENKCIRNWLRTWSLSTGKIQVNAVEMDIHVVLDELTHEPLGLGQGDFAIHQGFHFGLLGRVGTLFVMMSNKTAKLGKQFPQH